MLLRWNKFISDIYTLWIKILGYANILDLSVEKDMILFSYRLINIYIVVIAGSSNSIIFKVVSCAYGNRFFPLNSIVSFSCRFYLSICDSKMHMELFEWRTTGYLLLSKSAYPTTFNILIVWTDLSPIHDVFRCFVHISC